MYGEQKIIRNAFVCILLALVSCSCHSRYSPTGDLRIVYVFPSEFKGVAKLYGKRSDGIDLQVVNNTVTLIFPESGELKIKGELPQREWHQFSARYYDQKAIMVDSADEKGRPISDDVLAFRRVGESDDVYWFVIGTFEDVVRANKERRGF